MKVLTALEIAIVLGPLMPIAVPLTGLSILPSLFQFRIGCRDFNARVVGKNASLGPCWFLALTLMLGQGLAVFFFYDSDLFSGLPIVAASAAICAFLSLVLLFGFGGTLLNFVEGLPAMLGSDNYVGLGTGVRAGDRRRPLLLEEEKEDFIAL